MVKMSFIKSSIDISKDLSDKDCFQKTTLDGQERMNRRVL
ncbi:hypothetical protein M116_0790 [Bacteroides fragilis str. 3719 A10]|nr:hypothetical protein M116_0790 [Bacteroides fragilis str. 3719 A10]EYA72729.1 hypothetical protein M132_0664 [Bacteroides fragilis str. S24L15]EYA77139.1 hypothetical protein M133_0725 [Bacteroides fragilis str. S24L26]EYA81746.1 hypothetical protein M134_0816 [Bacteroides fragilis str. S24L34]